MAGTGISPRSLGMSGIRGLLSLILLLSATLVWAQQADCVQLAAEKYGVQPLLVEAILAVEGGRTGQAVSNRNGSEDLGPMQINTVWLPSLENYGITRQQLQHDRCINILVGAWILSRQFQAADRLEGSVKRKFWWAIGAYHSRTPELNLRYAIRVWKALQALKASTVN